MEIYTSQKNNISVNVSESGNANINISTPKNLSVGVNTNNSKGDPGYTPVRGVDYWTEEDKEEIVGEVVELATGDLKENIDDLYNQYQSKLSERKEFIMLKDSSNMKINSINFTGFNTQQEGQNSKNLYNYKDGRGVASEAVVDEEGWITLSYNNSQGETVKYLNYFTYNLKLQTDTQYAIFLEVKNVSGSGYITVTNSHADSQFANNGSANYFTELSNNSVVKYLNRTKASFEGTGQGIRTYCNFAAGESGSITFRLSVLEDTTVTVDNFVYEPFPPTPGFPQHIDVCKDTMRVYLDNGIHKFDLEVGTINENTGTSSNSTSRIRTKDFLNCNDFHTVEFKGLENISIFCYDENKDFIGRVSDQWSTSPYTFEVLENTEYIKIVFKKSDDSAVTLDELTSLKIYDKIQIYELNLGDIELVGKDDIQDSIIFENNIWYLNKKWNKIVLDGTEDWKTASDAYNRYYLSVPDVKQQGEILSNQFDRLLQLADKNVADVYGKIDSSYWSNGYIFIQDYSIETLDNFKTFLSNNKPIVYYELLEPQKLEITDKTLLSQLNEVYKAKTYRNMTNIYTDNDKVLLEVDYIRDSGIALNEWLNLKNSELKEENEYLYNNQMPEILNGDYINDSAEMIIKDMVLYGNSYQYTTTGKNLFNIDKKLTFTHMYTLNVSIPAGTYILSYKTESHGGSNSSYVRFNTNNTGLSLDNKTQTITLNSDETVIYIYSNGYSYNNSVGISATIEELMLSVSGGDYEPYTGGIASPNPDYPQQITNVTRDIEVKFTNQNMFKTPEDDSSLYSDNTKILDYDDGAYEFSVAKINRFFSLIDLQNIWVWATINNVNDYCLTSKGGEIHLSFELFDDAIEGSAPVQIYLVTNKKNNVVFSIKDNTELGKKEITYTLADDEYVKNICVWISADNTSNEIILKNFNLSREKEEDYLPHEEQSYLLTLDNIELCGDENVRDYICGSTNDWYIYKNWGKIVLNGSDEEIALYDSYNGLTQYVIYIYDKNLKFLIDNTSRIISSHFKGVKYTNSWNINNSITIAENNMIIITTNKQSTLEEFKNWLSTNNVTVYYQLSFPIVTKIENKELNEGLNKLYRAKTYKNKTNIYAVGEEEDMNPIVKLTYFKDLQTMFDKQQKEIDEIKALLNT